MSEPTTSRLWYLQDYDCERVPNEDEKTKAHCPEIDICTWTIECDGVTYLLSAVIPARTKMNDVLSAMRAAVAHTLRASGAPLPDGARSLTPEEKAERKRRAN